MLDDTTTMEVFTVATKPDPQHDTGTQPREESLSAAIWRIASSLELAVILMALLAVLTALGTLVLQNETPEVYFQRYGSGFGGFIMDFGFDDMFHSALYQFNMLLLVINLVLCTIKRPLNFHYMGFYVTHMSLIVLLIGGIIGAQFGDKGYFDIHEGQTANSYGSRKDGAVHPLPFQLKLDKFSVEYKEPEHRLYILGKPTVPGQMGEMIANAVLKAHKPVSFMGVLPGKLPDISVKEIHHTQTNKGADREPVYTGGATLIVDGTPHELTVPGNNRIMLNDILISYNIAPIIGVYRSEVTVTRQNGEKVTHSLIVNDPLELDGYRLYQSNYRKDASGAYTISGLEVVHDPGIPVAFLGFWLLMLGIFWQFYFRPWFQRKGRK